MKSPNQSTIASHEATATHKRCDIHTPPDALRVVDKIWRFHETLDAGLADSKSEYVADLIRRDALQYAKTSASGSEL